MQSTITIKCRRSIVILWSLDCDTDKFCGSVLNARAYLLRVKLTFRYSNCKKLRCRAVATRDANDAVVSPTESLQTEPVFTAWGGCDPQGLSAVWNFTFDIKIFFKMTLMDCWIAWLLLVSLTSCWTPPTLYKSSGKYDNNLSNYRASLQGLPKDEGSHDTRSECVLLTHKGRRPGRLVKT